MRQDNRRSKSGKPAERTKNRKKTPTKRLPANARASVSGERALVEKALHESNELLERVFSGIDLMVAYMDRDFNFIRVNRAYAQANGKEPDFYPGKNHFSLFPNEENEAIFRRVVETGEAYYVYEKPFEYAQNPERGVTYWDWSLHPIRERDGSVGGVVLSLVDVTARRRAQDELRESEELLRQVLDLLPVGVWITDRSGKIILGNPAGRRIWAGARYVGIDRFGEYKAWWAKTGKLVEPEEWAVARAIRKGETSLDEELEIECFDGTRKIILNSALPIRNANNEIVAAIVVNQDITERKAAEKELLRLATAMEQAAEGIAILGVDWTILYVNPAFERINEVAREQVLGRAYDEIKGNGFDGLGIKQGTSARSLDGGIRTGHVIRTCTDGAVREVDVTISPATDSSGAIINYVVLERDVTEEMRLQRHMRQVQKMEALGTLAGGIAHDFNNILMPILINTEMALQDAAEAKPISHYLQLVLEAANRGKELMKQIIPFTRQREEARATVEVPPIIHEALKFLRASIPKNIEILEQIDPMPGMILGDPTQIQQVLMNLCSNAAYAMREKGGVLRVTLAPVEIEGEAPAEWLDLKHGPYAKLTVSDTGAGMDRETLERAFDPFFTTKPLGEGTGLGLAVVHRIVKNHGGTVTAYSEKGKGSTFSVFLPLIAADQASEGPLLPRPIPKGTERILLVDDEEIQVRSVKPMLERLGYTVVGKTSALDALELFRAQPGAFDLVITDQTMPQMMGHELAQELLRIRPDVPVILCTGFSQALYEEQVQTAGIRALVMKPFRATEIAEKIRRALEKNRLE
ncbi:MAG: PAS domain-containing protein [candidate division WOR-3 bacterium]